MQMDAVAVVVAAAATAALSDLYGRFSNRNHSSTFLGKAEESNRRVLIRFSTQVHTLLPL